MTCQDSPSLKEPMVNKPDSANALSPRAYRSISFAALDAQWHFGSSHATCIHGGIQIDIDALVRIADLFRFRWDPAVLAVLAERPYRYRALHTRLETHVGEHVDDNALTRSLHRVTRSGMVRADDKRYGSRVIKTYALTERGRDNLMTYEAIVAVYAHIRLPAEECDGCCAIHTTRHAERAA